MTLPQIKRKGLEQLKMYADPGKVVDADTQVKSVIGNTRNRRSLFEGSFRWILVFNKHERKDKGWPKDFLNLTVTEIAEKLLILFLCFSLSLGSMAQAEITIGAAKTDLGKNALNFLFTYLKTVDSAWAGQTFMGFGKKSWIMVAPEIKIQTGTQDAFSSLTAKAKALAVYFQTYTDEEGIVAPDATRLMHTFPLSLGVETNNLFNFINGIASFGWVPWYHSPLARVPSWVQTTDFGVEGQIGYKWKTRDTTGIGGQLDESLEKPNEMILRARGFFSIDTREIIKVDAIKIGLSGIAEGWYDFMHGKAFYSLIGDIVFYLSEMVEFKIGIQKNAGAPNFTEGTQPQVAAKLRF